MYSLGSVTAYWRGMAYVLDVYGRVLLVCALPYGYDYVAEEVTE